MKKKVIIIILFLSFIGFCVFLLKKTNEEKMINEGNEIIKKIELYKKRKGFLPKTLEEIGIEEKMEGPLYYEKLDTINYIIWFGTSLGESVIYYSDTEKWENRAR